MSISSTTRTAGPYTGTGLVDTYPFGCKVFEAADLTVIQTTVAGAAVPLVLSADYTVTLNVDQDTNPGGSVRLLAGALPVGDTLDITTSIPMTQPVSLPNGGPFFAKVVEGALDRLTILMQQLGVTGIVQALRVPEFGGIPALPPKAVRASKILACDSNGDVVPVAGIDASSATALDLSLRDSTNALKGMGQLGLGVGLAYAFGTPGAKLSETISLSQFSGVNDYARFSAWVAAVNASTAPQVEAIIPPGNYTLDSALIGSGSYLLWTRDRVNVRGIGLPQITITGTTINNAIFASVGRSKITYRGVRFVGNNQASAYSNGAALWFVNNSVADIDSFLVEHCEFENFRGNYWVYGECIGSKAIRGAHVRHNKFISASGNAKGPTNVADNAAFVCFVGNAANSAGFFEDTDVSYNTMNAEFIKTGVILYNYHYDYRIWGNRIKDAGKTGISDDAGAYAIQLYGVNSARAGGSVIGNRINGVRSCGIYQAGPWIGTVYGYNIINGQTDTVTATLPKGGIVLNGGRENTVIGNTITDIAAAGVWWNPDSSVANNDAAILINANPLTRCNIGVGIEASQQNARNVTVSENPISECTTGVQVNTFTTSTLTALRIVGNHIKSSVVGSYGVRMFSGDTSYKLDQCLISGGSIDCDTYGVNATGFTVGSIAVKGVQFFGPFSDSAINVSGSTKVDIEGNGFQDFTSGGFCFKTAGAQGNLKNNTFRNVSGANIIEITASEDLGRDTPTWSGSQGVYVQNLTPQDTTVGGLNSTLDGWRHNGTNWRAQHMLY